MLILYQQKNEFSAANAALSVQHNGHTAKQLV